MSGLNSISGLNKVSVDFRPEFNVVADSKGNKLYEFDHVPGSPLKEITL